MTTRPFALAFAPLVLATVAVTMAAPAPAFAADDHAPPHAFVPALGTARTPSPPPPSTPPRVLRQVRPVASPGGAGARPAFGNDHVDIAGAFFPVGARVTHQEGNVVRTLVVGEDRRSYEVSPPRTMAPTTSNAPRATAAAVPARAPAPATAPATTGAQPGKGFWASAGARFKRALGPDRAPEKK